MSKLLDTQFDIAGRIDSFVSNFGKTPKDRLNVGYLIARESGLKELWAEFVAAHKQICDQIVEEERAAEPYFRDRMFDQYEATFFDCVGRITQKKIDLTPAPIPPSHNAPSTSANAAQQPHPPAQPPPHQEQFAHHIQIPRLNVPEFHGSYDQWPSFRDLFVAAVHSNPNLLPVHKLQYLKSLVKGTAESLLKHIPTTANNYNIAWEKLEERFDNKRALITATLRKLFTQQHADESAASIRLLLDSTRECIAALQLQGIETNAWDSILIYVISQFVPETSLNLWEQTLPRNELPTIENLLQFLENRFRILEFSACHTPAQPNRSRAKPQAFHSTAAVCRLCQGAQHALRKCPKFIEMQPNQRLNYVTKAKLCKNCFAFSHSSHECNSAGRCYTCGERHHSMLHLNSQVNSSSSHANAAAPSTPIAATTPIPPAPPSAQVNAHMSRFNRSNSDTSLLATALVTVTAYDGQVHKFRTLLDNCSEENFVSKRVVQFLGIKPKPTSMGIGGIGQSQAPKPIGQVRVSFGSLHDETFSMTVDATVLSEITHPLPKRSLTVNDGFVADVPLADPTYGTPGDIDLLFSSYTFAALAMPEIRKDTNASTLAMQTQLGWVLFGEAMPNSTNHQRACFHITAEDHVATALQEFWRIEEVPAVPTVTPEDEKCELIYATTHSRNADGRYCVELPFHTIPPQLGTSRDRAVTRFLQTERKLLANPQLHVEYAKCINEYVELGHMHPVSTTEQQHRISQLNAPDIYSSYYLPHHAVIKEDSTTTKVRVVFDASSKSSSGISLNESMLIGPTLQDNLCNLLLRWRTHKIVIKADIAKMYRQIRVSEDHQPFQRIVWRNSQEEELQDFELQTVTFGTAAAPYLAIKTIQQLAIDESARFPIGADSLQNDFYVDDLLSGADTIEGAIEKQHEVVNILQSGGFEIRKWVSNCEAVTNDLDDTAREICSTADSTLKALGILWCPQSDTLSIKAAIPQTNTVCSKRSLLSEISKLFDPLGWIAPVIIRMKMLLQRLWLAGLSWDEPLPDDIQMEWREFQQHISAIESIAIGRWINTHAQSTVELHGFCDASEKAYAAVIYVRVQTGPNQWAVHLITAKTRVAPIQQVSLPRLELCGAVLLTKLLAAVQHTIPASRVHAWTDSEIVLAWLQGHPNRWKTFVANRISMIHQSIDAAAWHHVPSQQNPADCASRGITAQQILDHALWWHGPKWLAEDEQHWPRKNKHDVAPTDLERKQTQAFVTVPINDTIGQILNDCATLQKAVRVTAYIRRWRRKPETSAQTVLTASELQEATDILLRFTQRQHFAAEFEQLSQNQPTSKNSKLLSLNPFIDDRQLLRVGGRLQNANIPYSSRHPLIVPHNSRFTELLIANAHKRTLHGNISLMLCHLRTEFWIINARNAIRYFIHKCNQCFKYTSTTLHQLMGQLPQPRVNVAHPFSHVGIDYAGPISILLRRHPGRPQFSKGYICLFVCLATKAIHLELVGDMSAATFLSALDRFTSRRGLPSDIYTDNGTYFVRAATDIDADMTNVQETYPQEAAKRTALQGIQWHFIPPAAPHFGGLWEAGVKSTKYHLKRITKDGTRTYEELTTILCQIEGCLNSRPLCPISNNIDDFETLTPGHFLIGRPILTRPQPTLLDVSTNRLSHWQRIYKTTEEFWKQWQSEYLSRLQQRPKWLSRTNDVQVGELVLLKEENVPPAQWKLARIIEVHRGNDNLIRVVTIKTPTTTLKRPIVKICKLPTQ